MRKRQTEMQQRGLWDRFKSKPKQQPRSEDAPVTRLGLRQVSLKALPSPDVRLRVTGRSEVYSFKQVMECGAEYTYLLLVKYSERGDPYGEQLVVPLARVVYAE